MNRPHGRGRSWCCKSADDSHHRIFDGSTEVLWSNEFLKNPRSLRTFNPEKRESSANADQVYKLLLHAIAAIEAMIYDLDAEIGRRNKHRRPPGQSFGHG